MANPFVHVELHSNDLKKAKEFYSKLFGWKLKDEPMPSGTYTMRGRPAQALQAIALLITSPTRDAGPH